MEELRTQYLQANDYERSNQRVSQRNGYYEREWTTRIGTLHLKVPRTRDGKFSPTLFERYQRNEKACQILDEGFEDAFQYTIVERENACLRSTHLIERLNEEIRRREKVVRIFPNVESANRLIDAMLLDIHEEWISSSRKYIKF